MPAVSEEESGIDVACEERRGSAAKSEEDLISLASRWADDGFGGYGRDADGRLNGWWGWAASHPHGTAEVPVGRGRAGWAELHPPRKEERAEGGGPAQSPSQNPTVSVVSWNILSDTWYEQDPTGEYPHTPEEHGRWEGRFPLFLRWIRELRPDVLALQEVDFSRFTTDILPELRSMGYDGRMQSQKRQNKTERQPCGVATFWRTDTLRLEGETPLFSRSLGTLLELVNHHPNETSTQGTTTASTTTKLCIVNVHLESAQTAAGADKRARQLNSPLRWAAHPQRRNSALVVCGDCNTGADSALFDVLRRERWHGHSLASVYEHPSASDTMPVDRGTFLVPRHHYVIDHMFYSHDNARLRLVLDALSPEEREEHVGDGFDRGFPSSLCPSDHIPIGAVLELLEESTAVQEEEEEAQEVLDPHRRAELQAEWEELRRNRPPHSRGKPSPEEIERRRVYARSLKEWKQGVAGRSAELAFVTECIKRGK